MLGECLQNDLIACFEEILTASNPPSPYRTLACESLLLYYINQASVVNLIAWCRKVISIKEKPENEENSEENDDAEENNIHSTPKISMQHLGKELQLRFGLELDSLTDPLTDPIEEGICSKKIAGKLLEKIADMAGEILRRNNKGVDDDGMIETEEFVFGWGSNSSSQLTDVKSNEKFCPPVLVKKFGGSTFACEAGQYCSFIIEKNGKVSSCGKGVYGRLGTGESSNQKFPVHIRFQIKELSCKIVEIVSSKGSDGHSIALSESGQIFSWGDSDHGKLGHDDVKTGKRPKLIEAFQGMSVTVRLKKGFFAGNN